jgi:site-specific DNA recombinase
LKGFVHGIDGKALTPTYTNKSHKHADGNKVRKRYRYYVSQQAIRQGYKSSILKTINAHLLEETVRQVLIQALPRLGDSVLSVELSKDQIQHRLEMHATALSRSDSALDFARWIVALSPKIVVGSESVQIHFSHPKLSQLVETLPEYPGNEAADTIVRPRIPAEVFQSDDETTLTAKIEFQRQRGRVEVIDGCTGNSVSPSRSEPNATLIQTIVQAEFWRAELQKHPSKPLNEVTRKFNTAPAYVRRLLNAAYLAPAIKRAIFQGTQPATLQVQDLIRQRSADWQVQILELGFGKILPTARH